MAHTISKKSAICYVADKGYIFPTYLSVLSLRRYQSAAMIDIFILTLGIENDQFQEVLTLFGDLGVSVVATDPRCFSGFDVTKYNKTHVPPSALGRFFLTEMLPSQYEKIIYIDGDTWFARDPQPLIDFSVPGGHIAAAEDPSFYWQFTGGQHGKATRDYLDGLGIQRKRGYFNSGLLVADRPTFKRVSQEAFEFFVNNVSRCRYHDQSALNVVAEPIRIRLAPKWNCVTAYCLWDADEELDPYIYHFTGGVKPWLGLDETWPLMSCAYREAVGSAPVSSFGPTRASDAAIASEIQSVRNYRLKLRTVLRLRRYGFRKRLFDLNSISILGGAR